MAKAAFRESGKPSAGKFVTKSGDGLVLAAPGANKAYIIYDITLAIVNDSGGADLRETAGGVPIVIISKGNCNLVSPIQWKTNTDIYILGAESGLTYMTLTYEIVNVGV